MTLPDDARSYSDRVAEIDAELMKALGLDFDHSAPGTVRWIEIGPDKDAAIRRYLEQLEALKRDR